jgi:hypothetical protein
MFKNKKQKNTTILLAVILVALLWWKFIKNNPENLEEENSDILEKQLSENLENQEKKETDLYKWVDKGDTGTTVKKVQKRLQLISKLVNNNFDNWHNGEISNKNFEWLLSIFNLYKDDYQKFKVDGIYGDKTEQFVKIVMGKNGTNIFLLRKKYVDISNLIKSVK